MTRSSTTVQMQKRVNADTPEPARARARSGAKAPLPPKMAAKKAAQVAREDAQNALMQVRKDAIEKTAMTGKFDRLHYAFQPPTGARPPVQHRPSRPMQKPTMIEPPKFNAGMLENDFHPTELLRTLQFHPNI